jgi:protein-L-isoaspartate(D-aspartate) O-methyltransferase
MQASPARSMESTPDFFAAARLNMVEAQIKPNKILDEKLVNAFLHVPRELFVPDDQKPFAYSDEDVSLGFGRKLIAPMVLARMMQELRITPSDRVLDIGAGTGYASAILNEFAGEIIALETDPNLLRQLQQNKQNMELQISAVNGALCDGFAPASPYQAILIEGGIQWLPQKLINQLAEGGRLACVYYREGDTFGLLGETRIYEKRDGAMVYQSVIDASAALLPSLDTREKFEF